MNNEQFVEIHPPIKVFLGLGDSDKPLVSGEIFFAEAVAHWSPLAKLIWKRSAEKQHQGSRANVLQRTLVVCVETAGVEDERLIAVRIDSGIREPKIAVDE
jgi:hypothetical protein